MVPVWVEFPGLPIHLFEKSALRALARGIGVPLQVDESTATGSRLSKARVCVEYDCLKPKIETIVIHRRTSTGRIAESFNQEVVMADMPAYCVRCLQLGHVKENCIGIDRGQGKEVKRGEDQRIVNKGVRRDGVVAPGAAADGNDVRRATTDGSDVRRQVEKGKGIEIGGAEHAQQRRFSGRGATQGEWRNIGGRAGSSSGSKPAANKNQADVPITNSFEVLNKVNQQGGDVQEVGVQDRGKRCDFEANVSG